MKAWLQSKHCTIWAHHNISPEGDINAAALWFAREMVAFEKFRNGNIDTPSPWAPPTGERLYPNG